MLSTDRLSSEFASFSETEDVRNEQTASSALPSQSEHRHLIRPDEKGEERQISLPGESFKLTHNRHLVQSDECGRTDTRRGRTFRRQTVTSAARKSAKRTTSRNLSQGRQDHVTSAKEEKITQPQPKRTKSSNLTAVKGKLRGVAKP